MTADQFFRAAGWLSPLGKFFPCAPGTHEELAMVLDARGSKGLEEKGWVKILRPKPGQPLEQTIVFSHLLRRGKRLTRKQLAWLAAYFHEWNADEAFAEFFAELQDGE